MFCLSPVSFAIVLVRRVSPAVTRFGAAVIRVGPAVTRVGWPAAACSVLQPPSLDDVTEPADDVTIVDWSTGAPSREKVNNPPPPRHSADRRRRCHAVQYLARRHRPAG